MLYARPSAAKSRVLAGQSSITFAWKTKNPSTAPRTTTSEAIHAPASARDGSASTTGARAVMEKYLPLYTICEQPYKAIQTIKFMMEALGCASGPSRLPRQPLTEREQVNVLLMMREAGLLA